MTPERKGHRHVLVCCVIPRSVVPSDPLPRAPAQDWRRQRQGADVRVAGVRPHDLQVRLTAAPWLCGRGNGCGGARSAAPAACVSACAACVSSRRGRVMNRAARVADKCASGQVRHGQTLAPPSNARSAPTGCATRPAAKWRAGQTPGRVRACGAARVAQVWCTERTWTLLQSDDVELAAGIEGQDLGPFKLKVSEGKGALDPPRPLCSCRLARQRQLPAPQPRSLLLSVWTAWPAGTSFAAAPGKAEGGSARSRWPSSTDLNPAA